MINKVILLGNLGKDPEVRHLESGATVANFPVATNENYKDKNGDWQTKTEWHNVVAWRMLAERAERSLAKGMLVYLEGKLSTRKYTDKEGIEKYATDVVANMIRIVDRKEQTTGDSGYQQQNTGSSKRASESSESQDVEKTEEDDLPF